jgi:alcohol dehydrogenase class IV
MIKDFSVATTPQLHFGAGKLSMLPAAIRGFGTRVLVVTGARSFIASMAGQKTGQDLSTRQIEFQICKIGKEPTPEMIDAAVSTYGPSDPACVVAIGGGSVLDAGKAISAMLPLRDGVKNYLEGVGTKEHPGTKVPFIAVPTTAGTGSEATKNAVISETGPQGYKRSLRHNHFVPDIAIVDPVLTSGCPPHVTASSGMDAFTQLLESYVSTSANPLTDALAIAGLRHIARSLKTAYDDGENPEARADMSLAAYISGITLANAGLGLVHGFASPIGGFFDIPHGMICSALMAPANVITVRKLRAQSSGEALQKYAAVGKVFTRPEGKSDEYYIDSLLSEIESLATEMKISRLSTYGIERRDFQKIVEATDNKKNPAVLNAEEMTEVLEIAFG